MRALLIVFLMVISQDWNSGKEKRLIGTFQSNDSAIYPVEGLELIEFKKNHRFNYSTYQTGFTSEEGRYIIKKDTITLYGETAGKFAKGIFLQQFLLINNDRICKLDKGDNKGWCFNRIKEE